jgi:Lar family restriction alleviation protein
MAFKPKQGSPKEEAQEPDSEATQEGDKGGKAKDCPFCGSDNVQMQGHPSMGGYMQHQMSCKDCGAHGGQHSRPTHALDHWNGKHKAKKGSGKAVFG